MGESLADESSSGSQNTDVLSSKRADRPGEIDNSDLLVQDSGSEGDDVELRRMLEEGRDYVLVSQQVWDKLLDWYFLIPLFSFSSCLHGMLLSSMRIFAITCTFI